MTPSLTVLLPAAQHDMRSYLLKLRTWSLSFSIHINGVV